VAGRQKESIHAGHDSVKVVTMHSSKGLEFPVVCIPGIGLPSHKDSSEEEQARLLYVAMTRATHELIMTHGAQSKFADKVREAMGTLQAL
jgi:superfamily I DNA/RNA helicase